MKSSRARALLLAGAVLVAPSSASAESWESEETRALALYAVLTGVIFLGMGTVAVLQRDGAAGYVFAEPAGILGGAMALGNVGLAICAKRSEGHGALVAEGYYWVEYALYGIIVGAIAGGIAAGFIAYRPGVPRATVGAVFSGVGAIGAVTSALILYDL